MFQKNEFMAELVRRGVKVHDVAKAIGIDQASLYRKLNGRTEFTRQEVDAIRRLLKLTDEELLRIFFA